jgi:hypothetical protein
MKGTAPAPPTAKAKAKPSGSGSMLELSEWHHKQSNTINGVLGMVRTPGGGAKPKAAKDTSLSRQQSDEPTLAPAAAWHHQKGNGVIEGARSPKMKRASQSLPAKRARKSLPKLEPAPP